MRSSVEIGRIAVPTLVVVGDDDVLTPPVQAERVARALPHPRLEVLAGAGHGLMIERAETLNALIRDFASGSATPVAGNGR